MGNIKNLKSSTTGKYEMEKYSNSSFLKKKDADAIAFLKKHPIPKEWMRQGK